MKIILEYSGLDDGEEAQAALAAPRLVGAIQEFDEELRRIVKYGDDETAADIADKLRTKLRGTLDAAGVGHLIQ